MESNALKEAKAALRRCREEYEAILATNTFNGQPAHTLAGGGVDSSQGVIAFDAHKVAKSWSDFLIYANRIYEKLSAGANTSKTRAWAGRMIFQRRKDPLLIYLHQARNSDEHGFDGIVKLVPSSITNLTGAPLEMQELIGPADARGYQFTLPPGGIVSIKPAHAEIVEVHDRRHGDSFPPPTSHLGKPLANHDVSHVAGLSLAFLEGMVLDAQQRFG